MFISIWRIILNEVILQNNVLPVLCGCDVLVASEPFYHSDRITDFNVLIYVTNGTIYVTEDNMDYSVSKGELLFLKKVYSILVKKKFHTAQDGIIFTLTPAIATTFRLLSQTALRLCSIARLNFR